MKQKRPPLMQRMTEMPAATKAVRCVSGNFTRVAFDSYTGRVNLCFRSRHGQEISVASVEKRGFSVGWAVGAAIKHIGGVTSGHFREQIDLSDRLEEAGERAAAQAREEMAYEMAKDAVNMAAPKVLI